ncbi:MAG: hypothetical protein J6568_04990 [Snodgrassella sp.]|nr:hypothetical protein [Snodgrassella sp.]
MRDSNRHQRRFRTFNVIDDFNREALGIDMAVSLPVGRMSRYLDKLADVYPVKIHVDNRTEFTDKKFSNWATSHAITTNSI